MKNKSLIESIYNGIALAMGIAVIVLKIMNKLDVKDSISMIGIGLFSISLSLISKHK